MLCIIEGLLYVTIIMGFKNSGVWYMKRCHHNGRVNLKIRMDELQINTISTVIILGMLFASKLYILKQ